MYKMNQEKFIKAILNKSYIENDKIPKEFLPQCSFVRDVIFNDDKSWKDYSESEYFECMGFQVARNIVQ